MANRFNLPPRWIRCPRKSTPIADKFIAAKTPLDNTYRDKLEPAQYWTPSMALQSCSSSNNIIGLWIDLTNTTRFYNKEDIEKKGVIYVKIECRGHGECPSPEQTKTFIDICHRFISREPLKKILVHCTHGFNRTGFLICAYLVEKLDWSIDASVTQFAKCRQPGIYKADYLEALFQRYGDPEDAPDAPALPDWCYEDGDTSDLDDDGNEFSNGHGAGNSSFSRDRDSKRANAKFMEGVPGVNAADPRKWDEVQKTCQKMCGWNGRGFPGSQPVSLDTKNIQLLRQKEYLVSWKADGTRYMMLIKGEDEVYFVDRDNSVFQARGIRFLKRKNPNAHIENTLLDGEMIIDEESDGKKTPRYLIYDIVEFEKIDVRNADLGVRRKCIEREIIGPRQHAHETGLIDKKQEPFSVRLKDFWPIQSTKSLFAPKFTNSLTHEIDGLIFQPLRDRYKPGQCFESLKWKPPSHNSIDFKLKIVIRESPGELPEKVCHLYVNRMDQPYALMKYTQKLKEYNGKIVECTWDYENNQWKFMRVRTDKSFPNAYETAQSVMNTIRHPISKEYLLDFIERIPLLRPPPSQHHRPHHQHPQQHQQPQHQRAIKRPHGDNSDSQNNQNDALLMPPPPKRIARND